MYSFNVGDILFALAVFGVYWACRGAIMSSPYWLMRYLGHLFGIGIPIAVIGNPICYYLHHWIKCKMIAESTRMAFSERIANLSQPGAYQNPFKEMKPETSQTKPELPPLLTEAQIEQLNLLRQRTNVLEAKRFPKAGFNGVLSPEKNKVVPKAGVFTAKLVHKVDKRELNVVVMMATVQGARAFEQAYRNMTDPAYRVEGYELPARTGACYRVLYATYFRLGDTVVIS